MPFSPNIENLKPSATLAMGALAKRLAEEGRDIINLSQGEPDFDTPAFIAAAGIEAIRSGKTRYTPAPGMAELRKAIARHLTERAGRTVDWSGVVVSTGAKQCLFNAAFTLFGPGDEVLIAAPYWTTYPTLVELARARPVEVFGEESNTFKVNPAVLDAAATERTRGLIINTPCNPTGAVYTADELRDVAEWCRDRGVWIVSDEIYRNIYYGEDRPVAAGLLDVPAESLGDYVLVDGASKSYAMTGWRIGFSYSSPEVAAKFSALQSQLTSNATTPAQVAALAAYTDVEAASVSIGEMVAAFRRRRDLVVRRMKELMPAVPFIHPEGTFYCFFRVDGFFDDEVKDGTTWCSRLLEETGVALVPGGAFGDDRWVRLSYAAPDESIEEALGRIARFVHAGVSA